MELTFNSIPTVDNTLDQIIPKNCIDCNARTYSWEWSSHYCEHGHIDYIKDNNFKGKYRDYYDNYQKCLKCNPLIRCRNPEGKREKKLQKDKEIYGEERKKLNKKKKINPIDYLNEFCFKGEKCVYCGGLVCDHNIFLNWGNGNNMCMECKDSLSLGIKMVKAFKKKPKTLEEFYEYI